MNINGANVDDFTIYNDTIVGFLRSLSVPRAGVVVPRSTFSEQCFSLRVTELAAQKALIA